MVHSTRNQALDHSNFKYLPNELLLHCFSFLEEKSLGKLAQVCTFFREMSENNDIWKPLYCRVRTIQQPWVGSAPQSWVGHAKKVHEALKASFPNNTQGGNLFLSFWKVGYPNEALPYLSPESHSAGYIRLVYTIVGRSAKDKIAGPLSFENNIDAILEQLIKLLDESTPDKALALYQSFRSAFRKRNLHKGWWISHLIYSEIKAPKFGIKAKKEQELIYSYKTLEKGDRKLQSFLQGCCIIWLENKRLTRAFATLRCCLQLYQNWPSLMRLSETFLPRFSETFALNKNPEILWEVFGDTLFQYYTKDSQELLLLAEDAYVGALERTSDRSGERRMRVAGKLARLLCMKKIKSEETLEFQRACLPVLILKEYLSAYPNIRLRANILSAIIHLVRRYEIDLAYSFIVFNVHLPHEVSNKECIMLYFDLLELCSRINGAKKAVDCWLKLLRLENRQNLGIEGDIIDPFSKKDLAEVIYSLIEKSDEIQYEILSIKSDDPAVIITKAYTLYQQRKEEQAIRLLGRYMQGLERPFEKSSLDWLLQLSRRDFRAVVIYSLNLRKVEALEDYFLEMLDYHHTSRFFIYHNLAVRLFFEGYSEQAFQHLTIALEENNEESESYILKSLIHRQLFEEALAQQALQIAYDLEGVSTLQTARFSQKRLLIMPIKDEADYS